MKSQHISWLVGLGAALCSGAAQAQDIEIPKDSLSQLTKLISWTGVATSVLVLLAAGVILKVMRDFVEQMSQRFATRRLLFQKLATILQFIIYVGTGLSVIALSFRLDDNFIALIGGTAAVSVGFAIKDLVASFIAGIMIMVDRPFQVGDRVLFGGEYGDIKAIGLRSVRMVTLDDNIVTIPNNKFLSDMTSCGNYGALDMQVSMDFYIGIDQDLERARQIVNEATVSSRYVYLPKPVVVQVKQEILQQYVAIRLRVKAYVLDTRFEKDFETDVNIRVLKAFRQHSIDSPAILHRETTEQARKSSSSNFVPAGG